jgi:hypothetical protein
MPSLLTASDVLGTGWFGAVAVDVQPGKQSSRSRGSVIKRGRPPDEPRPILIQSPGQDTAARRSQASVGPVQPSGHYPRRSHRRGTQALALTGRRIDDDNLTN